MLDASVALTNHSYCSKQVQVHDFSNQMCTDECASFTNTSLNASNNVSNVSYNNIQMYYLIYRIPLSVVLQGD